MTLRLAENLFMADVPSDVRELYGLNQPGAIDPEAAAAAIEKRSHTAAVRGAVDRDIEICDLDISYNSKTVIVSALPSGVTGIVTHTSTDDVDGSRPGCVYIISPNRGHPRAFTV